MKEDGSEASMQRRVQDINDEIDLKTPIRIQLKLFDAIDWRDAGTAWLVQEI